MRTGPTNPVLKDLIEDLREISVEEDTPLWNQVAEDLERPRRERREVNIYQISDSVNDDEIAIVPGKVLGTGELDREVKVVAFDFSSRAEEKIKDSGGEVLTIREAIEENLDEEDMRLLG